MCGQKTTRHRYLNSVLLNPISELYTTSIVPRKNRTSRPIPFRFVNHEAGKTRYATKRQAEEAAEYQMLLKPNLELYTYKSDLDGGWYLTRRQTNTPQ